MKLLIYIAFFTLGVPYGVELNKNDSVSTSGDLFIYYIPKYKYNKSKYIILLLWEINCKISINGKWYTKLDDKYPTLRIIDNITT